MRNYKPAMAHMGMKAMRADGGRAKGGMVRADGGRADGGKAQEYTKDSNVMDEAKERKNGGMAKKDVFMDGAKTKFRRLDRPGRKRGGGVGSTSSPLTSAAHATQAGDHKADADELAH